MSEKKVDELVATLETIIPRERLTPIEMSNLLNEICAERGLACSFKYLIKNELNQELISRIKFFFTKKYKDLKNALGFKSERSIKNFYYQMVYAICDHHHFGIANNKKKLIKISYCKFAEVFEVNRKTTSDNQKVANFYDSQRIKLKPEGQNDKEIRRIFKEIEQIILEKI